MCELLLAAAIAFAAGWCGLQALARAVAPSMLSLLQDAVDKSHEM